MENNFYLYNNPSLGYKYYVADFKEIMNYTHGFVASWCTSFYYSATSSELVSLYSDNTSNIIISESVYNQIDNIDKGTDNTFSHTKNEIKNSVMVFPTSKTYTNISWGKADLDPILLAKDYNGIVFCSDYHEATHALNLGIPYVFKISASELKESNGIYNYPSIHIRKIGQFLREIKK